MSIALLFKKADPATIGQIQLDVSLSESHEYRSDVSEYPVEDGSVISDHISNKSDRLSLNGFVTNSPIDLLTGQQAALSRTGRAGNRVETVFEELLRIHEAREPVKIVTSLRVYDSMAMESLSVPRNAQIGEALEFSVVFVEIQKVKSETVSTEALAKNTTGTKKATKDQASSTRDKGKQNTSSSDGSVAFQIFSALAK